ncbi:MAG TPA: DUF2240 family protein [Candidatus Thermoplasmatota archaeon]|nr:DUF2240 family protein [Candidatus Thermoplasmatota archaeon]
MGDAEAALAFVALRQARACLLPQEWVHVLSLDLGWMPPAQARRLVERAHAAGLLVPDGDGLRLALDPATVPIPPLFRPRPDAAPEPAAAPSPPDGFVAWLDAYTRQAGCDRAEALRRVAARQQAVQGLLTADAALLWIAAEAGLDVRRAAARLIGRAAAAAATTP